jgi:hypothetical protein
VTTSDEDPPDSGPELARSLLAPAWPRVRRIPLIRREIRESLSDNALEILFASAELLVEGDAEDGRASSGGSRGYATVMLTLDLRDSAELLREPADEATALRVAELMRGSRSVRAQLIELARPELAKMFGADPGDESLRIELLPVVRVQQTRILIDGDAVVSLGSGGAGAGGRGSRGQVGQ